MFSVFVKKVLISETESARAKRTEFWDHQRKKKYPTEKFHFWSCDLEKVPILPFLRKKCLSRKRKALERNGRNFGITKGKKSIRRKNFIFGHVTLKKCRFCRFCGKSAYLGNGKRQSETDEILGSPKEKKVSDEKISFLVM